MNSEPTPKISKIIRRRVIITESVFGNFSDVFGAFSLYVAGAYCIGSQLARRRNGFGRNGPGGHTAGYHDHHNCGNCAGHWGG